MKVYIAGKITGTTDYKERFRDAAKWFEHIGDIPLNPVQSEGMSAEDYMSMCLPMLLRADAVALLPDWEKSPGARIEKTLAEYCGKQIIFLPKEEEQIGIRKVVKCKDCVHRGLDRTCVLGVGGTERVSREFFSEKRQKERINAMSDSVNHPEHYTSGGIECIDAIRASLGNAEFADFCKGNVMKYLWRYRRKNGVEDLKKALVYLNWLIEAEERNDEGKSGA